MKRCAAQWIRARRVYGGTRYQSVEVPAYHLEKEVQIPHGYWS